MRLLVLAVVVACRSPSEAPAGDTTAHEDALAKLAGFTDRICACTAHACAKQINGELETYTKQLEASLGSGTATPASAQLRARLNDVMNRYTQCLTKAMRLPAAEPAR